jgi:hypothetical protein
MKIYNGSQPISTHTVRFDIGGTTKKLIDRSTRVHHAEVLFLVIELEMLTDN